MRKRWKQFGIVFATVLIICGLSSGVPARAAAKWAFYSNKGKKAAVDETITLQKGEYHDMNLYRYGKQVKPDDATYKVSWYSSDTNVVYIEKSSGKLRADKYGKVSAGGGSTTITAVIKNKTTGGMTKQRFTIQVAGENQQTVPIGLTYEISDGYVTITGYSGNELNLVIPQSIEGYPVTAIGEQAFYWSDIKSIGLPEGLTVIGREAFAGCNGLSSVVIPDSVKTMEKGAFYQCSNLKKVTVSKGITKITEATFAYCSKLNNVALPESVKKVENLAFFGCTGLLKIRVPKSVTEIGELAFFASNSSLVLKVKKSSYAHKFAKTQGISFAIY